VELRETRAKVRPDELTQALKGCSKQSPCMVNKHRNQVRLDLGWAMVLNAERKAGCLFTYYQRPSQRLALCQTFICAACITLHWGLNN